MSNKRVNYTCKQLGIKLRKYDPHPNREAASKYSKQPEDCSIRAICKLTGREYVDVYDSLLK